jgi:GNAT superfamily N-acetyltransferase
MGTTHPQRIRIDPAEIVIRPLDSKMDRAAFSCGDEADPSNKELSIYFRQYAAEHHQKGWVRVYVGLYRDEIVAYYWLSTQGADPNKLSIESREHMGRIEFASCVYLGMLATRSEYQGNGIGPTMMVDAFRRALAAATHVGIYAITLQAINKRTAGKYAADFDFRAFDDGNSITDQSENIWMFLPLETVRRAFAQSPE